MDLSDIVLNYLTDNEKGMQQFITGFLNDVINEEVAQQTGVPPYARSIMRRAHRNGYLFRSLKTRFGELSLLKPQLREIPFETKILARHSRTEKALVNAIIESYLQGVSTCNVEDIVSCLGVNQLSAMYVSKVGREHDAKVQEFMEKPLDSYYPYLFVDSSYFTVRDEDPVCQQSFSPASGLMILNTPNGVSNLIRIQTREKSVGFFESGVAQGGESSLKRKFPMKIN